jgi:hypothetical protein
MRSDGADVKICPVVTFRRVRCLKGLVYPSPTGLAREHYSALGRRNYGGINVSLSRATTLLKGTFPG